LNWQFLETVLRRDVFLAGLGRPFENQYRCQLGEDLIDVGLGAILKFILRQN
jgi:hypothetical protein